MLLSAPPPFLVLTWSIWCGGGYLLKDCVCVNFWSCCHWRFISRIVCVTFWSCCRRCEEIKPHPGFCLSQKIPLGEGGGPGLEVWVWVLVWSAENFLGNGLRRPKFLKPTCFICPIQRRVWVELQTWGQSSFETFISIRISRNTQRRPAQEQISKVVPLLHYSPQTPISSDLFDFLQMNGLSDPFPMARPESCPAKRNVRVLWVDRPYCLLIHFRCRWLLIFFLPQKCLYLEIFSTITKILLSVQINTRTTDQTKQ